MDTSNETPEDQTVIRAERAKWAAQLLDIRNDAIVNGMKPRTTGETPEDRAKWVAHLMEYRERAIAKGMKLHTTDEILDALHDERAGGIGLERLWQ